MSEICSLDDGARKPHSNSWTRASDDSGNVRNARIATIWARGESSRLSDALTKFLFLSGLCVNFANARKQIADESAASTNSTDAQRKSEVGANWSYAMVSDSNIAIFLRRISPHSRDTPHQFLGYHRWCAIFKRAVKVIAADQKFGFAAADGAIRLRMDLQPRRRLLTLRFWYEENCLTRAILLTNF